MEPSPRDSEVYCLCRTAFVTSEEIRPSFTNVQLQTGWAPTRCSATAGPGSYFLHSLSPAVFFKSASYKPVNRIKTKLFSISPKLQGLQSLCLFFLSALLQEHHLKIKLYITMQSGRLALKPSAYLIKKNPNQTTKTPQKTALHKM